MPWDNGVFALEPTTEGVTGGWQLSEVPYMVSLTYLHLFGAKFALGVGCQVSRDCLFVCLLAVYIAAQSKEPSV